MNTRDGEVINTTLKVLQAPKQTKALEKGWFPSFRRHKISIDFPFPGNQTIQMYDNFEGFPLRIMHCLGWCHIVTPDLGNFKKSPKNGEKQEVFLPSLPDGVCFVSKATPNWECSLPHHPITSPLPKNHSKKSTSKRLRWKGGFFSTDCVKAKRSRFWVGHVLGGAYVQGLLCCMALFLGGGFSTSPQKVYEEIGFIHQDVLVIFEWDILHFNAKQPMSWVSPPAHDASHHQGWRLTFLGSGIPNLYLVL